MWIMEKTDYNNNTDSEGLQDRCNETGKIIEQNLTIFLQDHILVFIT